MLKVGFSDNYTNQVRRMLLQLLVWGLFITVGALVAGRSSSIISLLTGWTSSVLYFLLMCHRVKKSAELPPEQAVTSMRLGWLLWYVFMISMLVLSIHVPGIDFWAVVVGLFSLHIVLFVNAAGIVFLGLIANSGKSK